MPPARADAPRADAPRADASRADASRAGAPRVGLVLGAGGVAGGAFHAGVLAAIAEATGWDPRRATVVVGTSAGSITGASLIAGLSAGDLLARSEGRPMSAAGTRLMAGVGPPRRPPPPARGHRGPAGARRGPPAGGQAAGAGRRAAAGGEGRHRAHLGGDRRA